MTTTETRQVVIRNDTMSRALAYLSVFGAIAPVAVLAFTSVLVPPVEIPMGMFVGVIIGWFAYPLLATGSAVVNKLEKKLDATVSVEAASLMLAGDRSVMFPRDRLDGGIFFPAYDEKPDAAVIYVRNGPTVRVGLPRPEAKVLLRELALDPGQRAVSVRTAGGGVVSGVGCVGLFTGLLAGFLALALVAVVTSGGSSFTSFGYVVPAVFVIVPLVFLAASRRTLVLGNDGVAFGRLRRRFVPFALVSNVETAGGSLTVKTPHPSPVVVAGGLSAKPTDWQAAARLRIEEACSTLASMKPCPSADALACGGRELAAWRGALRAAATAGAGYRGVPIDLEQARAALAHPGARPDVRLGAAMFCFDVDAATYRSFIEAAAGATANARLRRAFRALLRGKLTQRQVNAVVASWATPSERGEGQTG